MRMSAPIMLTDEDRAILLRWSRGLGTPGRLVLRAKAILLAAHGKTNQDIAGALGVDRQTIGRWRSRFLANGPAGIEQDAPRGGRRPAARQRVVSRILARTARKPPQTATRWSTRALAAELHVSRSTVHRVWQAHGLKPHLTRPFTLRADRRFVRSLTDVVGLYLHPPEHAIVLCADENAPIRAAEPIHQGILRFFLYFNTLGKVHQKYFGIYF